MRDNDEARRHRNLLMDHIFDEIVEVSRSLGYRLPTEDDLEDALLEDCDELAGWVLDLLRPDDKELELCDCCLAPLDLL